MEHHILTPYTPEGYISQAIHWTIVACFSGDVTWGPGLEEFFMGSVKFAIDQVIYQEGVGKGTFPLYVNRRLLF